MPKVVLHKVQIKNIYIYTNLRLFGYSKYKLRVLILNIDLILILLWL